MNEVEFILYVKEQEKSKVFYQTLLKVSPLLDVPGMTEFLLATNVKLGLMPNNGIAKIISDRVPHPKIAQNIPRCELYLKVDDPNDYMNRGIALGAILVSELQSRDWGDKVGYIADLDGHIIAFAEKNSNSL